MTMTMTIIAMLIKCWMWIWWSRKKMMIDNVQCHICNPTMPNMQYSIVCSVRQISKNIPSKHQMHIWHCCTIGIVNGIVWCYYLFLKNNRKNLWEGGYTPLPHCGRFPWLGFLKPSLICGTLRVFVFVCVFLFFYFYCICICGQALPRRVICGTLRVFVCVFVFVFVCVFVFVFFCICICGQSLPRWVTCKTLCGPLNLIEALSLRLLCVMNYKGKRGKL